MITGTGLCLAYNAETVCCPTPGYLWGWFVVRRVCCGECRGLCLSWVAFVGVWFIVSRICLGSVCCWVRLSVVGLSEVDLS